MYGGNMKTMCNYYGGKSIYDKDGVVTGYSRYTRQFLHYLYMFSNDLHCEDDVRIAIDYLELFKEKGV
jgi:hypothetical protein